MPEQCLSIVKTTIIQAFLISCQRFRKPLLYPAELRGRGGEYRRVVFRSRNPEGSAKALDLSVTVLGYVYNRFTSPDRSQYSNYINALRWSNYLGNRCSIRLSYGDVAARIAFRVLFVSRLGGDGGHPGVGGSRRSMATCQTSQASAIEVPKRRRMRAQPPRSVSVPSAIRSLRRSAASSGASSR